MTQPGGGAGLVLRQPDQLDAALHRRTEGRQPVGEDRLGARLRQQQRERVWTVDAGADRDRCPLAAPRVERPCAQPARSEEHKSELQALMRISYAVLSLTKKKTIQKYQTI